MLLAVLLVVVCQEGERPIPVRPFYNLSDVPLMFEGGQLVSDTVTIEELVHRKAVADLRQACMVNADKAVHGNNRIVMNFPNITELQSQSNYLFGTTYWINDYLHVGHVIYDIALMQVLQLVKVDRIVMQRAVCHGSLCNGVGTWDSFYKGYYAAMMEAAGQPDIPVFLRWTADPGASLIIFRPKHTF